VKLVRMPMCAFQAQHVHVHTMLACPHARLPISLYGLAVKHKITEHFLLAGAKLPFSWPRHFYFSALEYIVKPSHIIASYNRQYSNTFLNQHVARQLQG